jgi:hypothetical protein
MPAQRRKTMIYKFKNSLFALVGLLALIGIVALIMPHTAVSKGRVTTAPPAPQSGVSISTSGSAVVFKLTSVAFSAGGCLPLMQGEPLGPVPTDSKLVTVTISNSTNAGKFDLFGGDPSSGGTPVAGVLFNPTGETVGVVPTALLQGTGSGTLAPGLYLCDGGPANTISGTVTIQ